jgi:hypothetical protein
MDLRGRRSRGRRCEEGVGWIKDLGDDVIRRIWYDRDT